MHSDEASDCSCHHEPGEWGSCGWHYYRMTEEIFVKQQMFRYFQTLRGSLKHSESEEERARQDAIRLAQHYIGQPIAFERCKPYTEAVERSIAGEKSRTANPLKSKRDYSERDWT